MDRAQGAQLNQLLLQLREGERQAIAPAYALLWPELCRFARALLSDPSEAEDAAQEALLKLFARAYQYEPGRDGRAWAFTFVAYECKTLQKRRLRRREQSWEEGAPLLSFEQEDLWINRQQLELAFELLGELKPLDRQTLLESLAADQRPGGATYRKRLERALRRLKLLWEARYGQANSQV